VVCDNFLAEKDFSYLFSRGSSARRTQIKGGGQGGRFLDLEGEKEEMKDDVKATFPVHRDRKGGGGAANANDLIREDKGAYKNFSG